jgi:two-component system, OmpR family, osmolarity sensor histidine kinase EnvZ
VIPRRLQTRLLVLLAVVVVAALTAAVLAFALSMRESNATRLARGLHAQVVAADALLAARSSASGGRCDRECVQAELRVLEIQWRESLPPGERPNLPLLQQAQARLGARLPGRPLRLSGSPAQLWVQAKPPAQGWIGIPVLGGPENLRRGMLFSLVAIGLLILVAAALFARSLAPPLQRLAEAAPGIVAGEPPPSLPSSASAEIVELQRALANAAERTQAAARDRELMLAGLSHDMRTPLARLRYALALVETQLDDGARDAMESDIDEIDGIVGQFIDYVRDGRDETEQDVDLAAMVRALVQREAQAGRSWTLHLPEPLSGPAELRGRPLALQRALGNLFANAARHGAPPFEAELEPLTSATLTAGPATRVGGWRLSVRDHGPGVPVERLPDLGRPFHRVDSARGTPGSGLGLASVARVAALHRGSLRLRNRKDGGFEAELRLGEA